MAYVVIGAGAVGGTVGGLLASAGHETILLARGAHAATIRERGLTIATPAGEQTSRVPVVESLAELRLQKQDVLLLAVKSQDTAAILPELATLPVGDRFAGHALPIFCVQNSVQNETQCARYFRDVHGMAVSLPAAYLEGGRIEAYGSPVSGILQIGRFPSGRTEHDLRIARDLTASGFRAEVHDDVMAWKRAKLLVNLATALEALCDPDDDAAARAAVAEAARGEARAVFAAAGLALPAETEFAKRRDGQMTQLAVAGALRKGGSTWQSIAKGSDSVETGYLNGEISLLGRMTGIPTPVNDAIVQRMARLVQGRIATGSIPASELLDAAAA